MAEKQETAEDFARRLGDLVVSGFSVLGIALAHDLGLFDLMSKFKEPKTSLEIANAAGMKERYVRELLGALVQAHIVDLDESGEKYYIPEQRVPFLLHDSPQNSDTVVSAALPALANSYVQVKECFAKDGPKGVPYDCTGMFSPVMEQMSGVWISYHLVQDYVPNHPEIAKLMESGCNFLDLGCETGKASLCVAKNFPKVSVYGVDLGEHLVKQGQEAASKLQLSNCNFESHSAASLPNEWTRKFHIVLLCEVLHDVGYPEKVLQEIHRILHPNGILSVIEPKCHSSVKKNLQLPGAVLQYIFSTFMCMPAAAMSEDSPALGAAWGEERATEMLTENGFKVHSVDQSHGGYGNHFYCTKV